MYENEEGTRVKSERDRLMMCLISHEPRYVIV